MALIQASLFVALVCLVSAIPQGEMFSEVNGWQPTFLTLTQTNFFDGTHRQIAFANITVVAYNYTQDSFQLVSNAVRRGISKIQIDSEAPEDNMDVLEVENAPLPLTFNMTLYDVLYVGPKPIRGIGLEYHVDLYSKKKHRANVLGALKNFSL